MVRSAFRSPQYYSPGEDNEPFREESYEFKNGDEPFNMPGRQHFDRVTDTKKTIFETHQGVFFELHWPKIIKFSKYYNFLGFYRLPLYCLFKELKYCSIVISHGPVGLLHCRT